MLPECDFDLHSWIGIVAEHFGDAAHRLRVALRLLNDFRYHDLTRFGAAACARRNKDVLTDAAVFRCHHAESVLLQETADDSAIRALEYLDDMPFTPPACVDRTFARDHAISMQHFGHFARIQE